MDSASLWDFKIWFFMDGEFMGIDRQMVRSIGHVGPCQYVKQSKQSTVPYVPFNGFKTCLCRALEVP